MKYVIFDIETNGLLDKVSKIHCLSYSLYESKTLIEKKTLTTKEQIISFLKKDYLLVGHNIINYDIIVLERLYNIKIKNKLFDTLGISYYLFPISKFKHGLEGWGERLGFGKPVINDWEGLPLKVYIDRCEADVEINTRLFHGQMDYLMEIYENDVNHIIELIEYLNFKLDSLKDQAEEGIPLDVIFAENHKNILNNIINEKINILSDNMPKELGKIIKTKPKVIYKKDGELSVNGIKWFNLLQQLNINDKNIDVIREKPNPTSPKQLKEWLFSLGWKPITFKVNKKGEKIPQVSLPYGQGLCPSVKSLFDDYPYLKDLDGLYKARHRFGLFKSFLENKDENNKVYSKAHGFTNTLRMQHSKPIANLPKPSNWYGTEVRACLTIPNDDYIMCGSDVSSLEDSTKQHYIYNYDPEYVKEMRVPGFDPHIDIGVKAELLTVEQEMFFKEIERQKAKADKDNIKFEFKTKDDEIKYKEIKEIRSKAKQVNFSATYGAGPPKISETLKCTLSFAQKLHKTYWDRNKAVKLTAKNTRVRVVNGQKWLYNPVSKFWYFLKAEKDRFSTLNQGTGVFVFDTWLSIVRQRLKILEIKVLMQYHDELLLIAKKEHKNIVTIILHEAMKETNKKLKLNVEVTISVDWGSNYAECH